MKRISIPSNGKINRVLTVGPVRHDGFHALQTIYQSVSVCDRITLAQSREPGIRIKCDRHDIPTNESNLAWQAAQLWCAETGMRPAFEVDIQKRIPVGGGLGGGSANAASMLMGLNRMFENPLSRDRLLELAADLGSDVPFFLVGGTAVGTGRGECITPMPDMAPLRILAIIPDTPFPTAAMYRMLDDHGLVEDGVLDPETDELGLGINTFEQAVSIINCSVSAQMERLRESGWRILLAGSGSTILLVVTGADALPAAKQLSLPHSWQTIQMHTLKRDEVWHVPA